jgi:biopolymer transport protein ExbB
MMPSLSRVWLVAFLTLALLPAIHTSAQTAAPADAGVESVATSSTADLKAALAELAKLQKDIEADKVARVQEINRLEQQAIERRGDLQKIERFQENQLLELNQLKSQVKARTEEVKFLEALVAEYARAFRTRTHVIETERLDPLLKRFDQASASVDLSPADKLKAKGDLLTASLQRIRALAGGERFEARVLAASGRLEKGSVAQFGPIAVFASAESDTVGLVQQELNKADPSVFAFPPALVDGTRQLTTTGTGTLGVDPTLGNAIKIASVRETLVEHFLKGGVVMWPMLLLALAALVVAGIKWVQLARTPLASAADLQKVVDQLNSGNATAALTHARTIPGPAGQLLVAAVEHADEKKEYIEEVLYEHMLNTKPRLESLIPFLGLTAAAAPLLGLLGTVTGMISTFQMISVFGTGDPRTMSSGISEALITTEYGLYIAIPAVLAHAFLNRKAKGILGSMEQTAVGFINALPERDEVSL